jgi:hypothetical protein
MLALAGPSAAAPSEADVKGAFVVNFVRFVEWPEAAPPDVIVVIEPDPLGRALDVAANDRTLPFPLHVRRIGARDAVPAGRIVFAGRGSGAAGLEALAAVSPATLTVGETEEFLARGGIIRLAVLDGRVRVEVNVDALERSSLHLSSKLLKIATLRRESELR